MTGRRYLGVLILACGSVMLPLLAANYYLGERAQGSIEITRAASYWQQQSRGVTYAPPFASNRPFKALRLSDRLSEINTIVFGASTALGISESHFPRDVRIYNFSHYGNSLASSLGEAEYASDHYSDRIKILVLVLDWSIGFLFENRDIPGVSLAPEEALSAFLTRELSVLRRLQDAVSYPRVAMLVSAVRDTLEMHDTLDALSRLFLLRPSETYDCPGGVRGKDFDVLHRGKCEGFYYDGSSQFPSRKRLTVREAESHLITGVHPNSVYASSLISTRGIPNAAFLARIAALRRNVGSAGGTILVLLPPLLPGLEERLSAAPQTAAHLANLKKVLDEWAMKEDVVIVDAGRSEGAKCKPSEFIDEHHATRECYEKIMGRFWSAYERGIGPGIFGFHKHK